MKSVLGIVVGVVLFVFAFSAFRVASGGWSEGHSDMGFWWTVIAIFLTIAACGAVVGTLIHSRPSAR